MKPSPFKYHSPRHPDDALAVLAEHGDDAKLLAGGQSLVPLLNFGLAHPEHLVDINRIGSLSYVRSDEDGSLRIGAMTRQSELEVSSVAAEHWPLLTDALHWVAHPQIRNRGTVGGSLAHADPAAELPIASAALDARFHVRSARGDRVIGWRDFFVTHLTTSMAADELLVEVEFPELPERTGSAFTEYARRHGDFALGGAAVTVSMDNGHCGRATIALLGASDVPVRADAAEQLLAGAAIDEHSAAAAAAAAVEGLEPTGDIHGGTEYRKNLIEAMVRRGVLEAAERARR